MGEAQKKTPVKVLRKAKNECRKVGSVQNTCEKGSSLSDKEGTQRKRRGMVGFKKSDGPPGTVFIPATDKKFHKRSRWGGIPGLWEKEA